MAIDDDLKGSMNQLVKGMNALKHIFDEENEPLDNFIAFLSADLELPDNVRAAMYSVTGSTEKQIDMYTYLRDERGGKIMGDVYQMFEKGAIESNRIGTWIMEGAIGPRHYDQVIKGYPEHEKTLEAHKGQFFFLETKISRKWKNHAPQTVPVFSTRGYYKLVNLSGYSSLQEEVIFFQDQQMAIFKLFLK